jgi:porin
MLWCEGDSPDEREQGFGLFERFGASPRDRSAFEWVASGGARYRGLLPGRDQDTLALGLVFAQVSRDLRHQQRDDRDVNGTPYAALADHEFVLELTYRCQLKPWLVVKPDFQWIRHPGGSAATPDAFLLGLRSNITF